VVERDDSDEAGLKGSSTVVFQDFKWYSHQFEMRDGRGRTEEDRARRFGGSKDSAGRVWGRCQEK